MARLVNSGENGDWRDDARAHIDADRSDWSDMLESGEVLLWSGKPAGKPKRTLFDIIPVIVGGGFVFIGLFFASMSIFIGSNEIFFLIFGLIFATIGGLIAYFFGAGRHRNFVDTRYYALTEKRAIIRNDDHVQSVPLTSGSNFNIKHHGKFSTIQFDGRDESVKLVTTVNGREVIPRPSFHSLSDAEDVFQHLKRITK